MRLASVQQRMHFCYRYSGIAHAAQAATPAPWPIRASRGSTNLAVSWAPIPSLKAPLSSPSTNQVSNREAPVSSCAKPPVSAVTVSNRAHVSESRGIVSRGSCSVLSRFGFFCALVVMSRCCLMSRVLGSSACTVGWAVPSSDLPGR
jgi:hypothetical protein